MNRLPPLLFSVFIFQMHLFGSIQIFVPQIICLFLGDAAAPKVRVDGSVQLITEAVQIKHLVFLSLQVFRNCLLNAGRKIFFKAGFICRLTIRTARISLVVRLYKLFQGHLSLMLHLYYPLPA